jgi:hypothetical protein
MSAAPQRVLKVAGISPSRIAALSTVGIRMLSANGIFSCPFRPDVELAAARRVRAGSGSDPAGILLFRPLSAVRRQPWPGVERTTRKVLGVVVGEMTIAEVA